MTLSAVSDSGGGGGGVFGGQYGGRFPSYGRGASTSSGSSQGSSSSASNPVNMQSPQSEWSLQLAQIEQQLGQGTYNWANQQFANSSALTDNAIGNYLGGTKFAQGMAEGATNDYNQIYRPQMAAYANEANNWASPARIAMAGGQAESDSMQASEAARIGAEENLRSFGIDPSSGRYAGLDEAQRTQAAASAVGAGNTAERATEQQGLDLQKNSIAFGQQLPGEAINDLNAGYSGLTGATNAELSNLNTANSMYNTANNFMNTAMNLKYPAVGQQSSSGSQNTSQNSSTSVTPLPTSGSGGGSRGPSSGSSPKPSSGGSGSGYGGGGGGYGGGSGGYGSGGGSGGGGYGGGMQGSGNYASGGYTNTTDPSLNSGGWDESGFTGNGDYSGVGNTQWAGPDSTGGGGYGGGGYGGGGYSGGGGYYAARGGDIPGMASGGIPTTGGNVSANASPSGGRQTDDIPARLNAHEFVVPQDTALWKGQEFFHDLINKSRKARQQMTAQTQAQPSMGAPAKGPPRFVSRHMAGAI